MHTGELILVRCSTVIVKVLQWCDRLMLWPCSNQRCFVEAREYQAKALPDLHTLVSRSCCREHAELFSLRAWAARYTIMKHYQHKMWNVTALTANLQSHGITVTFFPMWSLLDDPQGQACKGAVGWISNMYEFSWDIWYQKTSLSWVPSRLLLDHYQGRDLEVCKL